MVLHRLDKNGIDLCLFMKLFALILTLVALAPLVTGCSFAITPLIFLIDNNEIGSGHEASYAGRKEENRRWGNAFGVAYSLSIFFALISGMPLRADYAVLFKGIY